MDYLMYLAGFLGPPFIGSNGWYTLLGVMVLVLVGVLVYMKKRGG